MRTQSSDTSPEAERVLFEAYRRMSPPDKLARIFGLNRLVRDLAASAIRQQYGDTLSERDIKLHIASRYMDRKTMIAAFNWDPEDQGA